MANSINIPSVTLPIGLSAFEIDAPTRANGARITLTRQSWPVGPLFTWTIFERERNQSLTTLASAAELGGERIGRDGNPAPLIIELRWAPDKDKDRIRVEVDAQQSFTLGVAVVWL